jgi:hypothetical protein
MKDVLDKVKKICKEKILPFVKKQKRYLGAGVLFVCFVLVLVFFTGVEFNSARIAKLNSVEVSGEDYIPDAKFEVDAYEELNELMDAYFSAYVNADFATLEAVAYPITEMEQSYITTMSQFYDSYQNMKYYTKHGLSKDSFVVAARFDIKFAGQDVTAPSMMLFYVQTNEEGGLYINNLYSDFNMQYSESPISKDVYTALRKVTTQDDYLELYNEVEVAFANLIKENTEIYQLTKRTIPGTRQMWEDTVFYAQSTEGAESTESTESTENTESTQTAETTEEPDASEGTTTSEEADNTPEDEGENEPEAGQQKVRVKTESGVIVREGPGASYDMIGDAHDGDEFVKLGVENDENGEEWTKIQYTDSAVGYIKSTFIE